MLQDIRNSATGLVAKIIIGLIAISFALFGIESLTGGSTDPTVAEVNGEPIGEMALLRNLNQQKQRLLQAMGQNVDYSMIEDSRLRPAALENLIQRSLLTQAASQQQMAVAPEVVDRAIVSMPQFQVDGQFSEQLYLSALGSNGYRPAQFREVMAEEMVMNQLSNGLALTEFVTNAELSRMVAIANEQRSFRYITLPFAAVADQVEVSEEQINRYYQDNIDQFQRPEQVKLDYILLRQQDFYSPVSEDELRSVYQEELQELQLDTRRRAAHILLEINDQRDREATQKLAQELRQQLLAGADFASLAAEYSDDIGSAEQGGDLGFSTGDAFPEAFEQALAALSVEQISEPVETEAGIHLITLTEIDQGSAPSFAERRDAIARDLQMARSRADFIALVEDLRDLSFNAATLDGPAEQLSLQVGQSDWISRQHLDGLLADQRILSAAFSEEVLVDRNNSPVIELDESRFIVVRVAEYREQEALPLAQVRDTIVERVSLDLGSQLLSQQADKVQQQLQDGADMETLATESSLPWQVEIAASRGTPSVDRQLLFQVFSMSSAELPAFQQVGLANGDVLVVQLDKVSPGDISAISEVELDILRQQLQRNHAEQSLMAYQRELRDNADISIRE